MQRAKGAPVRGSGVATLESPPPLTALQPNDFYSAEDHGPGVFHLQNLFDETTRGNLTYLLNSGRGSEHDLKSADAAADSVLAVAMALSRSFLPPLFTFLLIVRLNPPLYSFPLTIYQEESFFFVPHFPPTIY